MLPSEDSTNPERTQPNDAMTTTQLSRLRAIDAHLAKLLDIAAKRTPGEWESLGIEHSNCLRLFAGNNYLGAIGNSDAERAAIQDDAAFITSCAGNAEAGWKATRAAIAEILTAHEAAFEGWCMVAKELEQDPGSFENYPLPPWSQHILAAFPLEALNS